METTTLVIRGRKFTVAKAPSAAMPWTLTGVRGAVYGTLRNVHSGLLIPFGSNSTGTAYGLDGVRLSDADGTLRLVRA